MNLSKTCLTKICIPPFYCGASEAESNLGITLSVCLCVRLSVHLSHFWFAYNFFTLRDRASYLACVFLMTRPFRWYHKFWACDLDRDLWPTAGDMCSLNTLGMLWKWDYLGLTGYQTLYYNHLIRSLQYKIETYSRSIKKSLSLFRNEATKYKVMLFVPANTGNENLIKLDWT